MSLDGASTFELGSVVAGRYELRAVLGTGGMGAVYRAWDQELEEEIALKVLNVYGPSAKDALVRFRREVKLARRVTHPNVARTYDLGVFSNVRFLTMELIAGESLRARSTRPLSLPEALRITTEIARGLSVAHAAGVVHCDLKPENVMLEGQRVVITDFGIARGAWVSDSLKTSGGINGTPAYMAPEQVECQELDGRADIYALSVMLFELVSGALPFDEESPIAVAAARLTRDAPDVRAVNPNVPANVASLIAYGLARRRDARLDAHRFLQNLEAIRAGERAPVDQRTVTAIAMGQTPSPGWMPSNLGKRLHLTQLSAHEGAETWSTSLREAIYGLISTDRRFMLATNPEAADLVMGGSVRVAGDRVRARLMVARAGKYARGNEATSPYWSTHVDGLSSEPFEFEDEVVRVVRNALDKLGAATRGPEDARLRGAYEEALGMYESMSAHEVRRAQQYLQQLAPADRADPWVMTLEARVTTRLWLMDGGHEADAPARAEELLLRALGEDPSIAEAHHAIGLLRLMFGDYLQARRAFEEALGRAPTLAASHAELGTIAAEAGNIDEGIRHLELAIRLQPKNWIAHLERFRVASYFESRPELEARMRKIHEQLDLRGEAHLFLFARMALRWGDRALAESIATAIQQASVHPHVARIVPLLQAFARNSATRSVIQGVYEATSRPVVARRATLQHEVATEYLTALGYYDEALWHIEQLMRLPFINVLWLDRCAVLRELRAHPRFAHVRAAVAARAALLA
jgi:serine/threonine-protein kinase